MTYPLKYARYTYRERSGSGSDLSPEARAGETQPRLFAFPAPFSRTQLPHTQADPCTQSAAFMQEGDGHEPEQPHRHTLPSRPPPHTRQGKRETDGVLVTRPAWSHDAARAEAVAGQAQMGGWFITAFHGATGTWWGMAKRAPFVDGGLVSEPGDLWVEPGNTQDEAIAAVLRDVGALT